jgi:Na+-driven multidrug efflux pump
LIGSCISYPGIAVVEAVCGALRGIGKTRSSLMLSLTMNLTYVLLNVVFINILRMGVLGMVISLNLARWSGLVCALVYLIKFNHTLNFHLKDVFHFDFSILKKISFIGIPFAAEQMFFNGGKILTQTFIVQLGTFSMAINAISGSMTNVFQIGGNALCLTVITVVGQCMGRRDIKDARKFTKSFVVASSLSFILVAAIILPLFPLIVQLFAPPAAIVPTIFEIVVITGIFQPLLWSPAFLVPSALRAAGDSKFTSIVSMLSMWLFRVVLGYLLGIILHFGIVGVWCAMIAEWSVRGTIFLLRFKGKKWYRHHVI